MNLHHQAAGSRPRNSAVPITALDGSSSSPQAGSAASSGATDSTPATAAGGRQEGEGAHSWLSSVEPQQHASEVCVEPQQHRPLLLPITPANQSRLLN